MQYTYGYVSTCPFLQGNSISPGAFQCLFQHNIHRAVPAGFLCSKSTIRSVYTLSTHGMFFQSTSSSSLPGISPDHLQSIRAFLHLYLFRAKTSSLTAPSWFSDVPSLPYHHKKIRDGFCKFHNPDSQSHLFSSGLYSLITSRSFFGLPGSGWSFTVNYPR